MSRTRNCTKKRHDRLGAQIALADLQRKSKRNSQQAQLREEAHIYKCATCLGWHVSVHARTDEEAAA
jgi:hypothetical protein